MKAEMNRGEDEKYIIREGINKSVAWHAIMKNEISSLA